MARNDKWLLRELYIPDLQGQIEGIISDLIGYAEKWGKEYQEAFHNIERVREALGCRCPFQLLFQKAVVLASGLKELSGLKERYAEQCDNCDTLKGLLEGILVEEEERYKNKLEEAHDFLYWVVIVPYRELEVELAATFSLLINWDVYGPYTASVDKKTEHRLWKAVQNFRKLSQMTYNLRSSLDRLASELRRMAEEAECEEDCEEDYEED